MRITCSPFCKSSSLAVYTFLFQSSRIQYSDSLIPSPPVCPPSLAQVVGDLVTFQPQELLMDFLLDLDLGSLLTYGLCAAAMAALFWLSTSLMPNTKFDHSSSRSSTKSRGRPQLPPGPTGLAGLVKFFRGLNKFELHLTATEWAKQYGEIVACNILGQNIIFLNSADISRRVFGEEFGEVCSDRSDRRIISLRTCLRACSQRG